MVWWPLVETLFTLQDTFDVPNPGNVRVIELLSTLVIAFMSLLGEIRAFSARLQSWTELGSVFVLCCVLSEGPIMLTISSSWTTHDVQEVSFSLCWLVFTESGVRSWWEAVDALAGSINKQQQHVQWSKVPGRDKYYDSCLHIKS